MASCDDAIKTLIQNHNDRHSHNTNQDRCPKCGDFVAKDRIETANVLKRVNCPCCGWGVSYDRAKAMR